MRYYAGIPTEFILDVLETVDHLIDLLKTGEQWNHSIPPQMLKRLEGMKPPLQNELSYRNVRISTNEETT